MKLKIFMLVIILFAHAAFSASDSVTINASFVVPSFISLSVVGDGDVDFGVVIGDNTYPGDNTTDLRIISTRSWTLTSSILWTNASTVVPTATDTAVIETALGVPYTASSSWGLTNLSVSYSMFLDSNTYLQEGNYNIVIQYTVTTD